MGRVKRGTAITAAGALALSVIGGFEGLKLNSYQDSVKVWTVCYGETKGIKRGMKFTKPECDAMFANRLVEFETGMRKCLKAPDSIPDKPYVTFLSLSYNIGLGAFCGSTLVKKANAGDIRAACNELPKWSRAGTFSKLLLPRRQTERKLCLEGLPS